MDVQNCILSAEKPKTFQKYRKVYHCIELFQVVRNGFQPELDVGSRKASRSEALEHAVGLDVP